MSVPAVDWQEAEPAAVRVFFSLGVKIDALQPGRCSGDQTRMCAHELAEYEDDWRRVRDKTIILIHGGDGGTQASVKS